MAKRKLYEHRCIGVTGSVEELRMRLSGYHDVMLQRKVKIFVNRKTKRSPWKLEVKY